MLKISLIFIKTIFLYDYQIRKTTFFDKIFRFDYFQKTLFIKNVPFLVVARPLSLTKIKTRLKGFSQRL